MHCTYCIRSTVCTTFSVCIDITTVYKAYNYSFCICYEYFVYQFCKTFVLLALSLLYVICIAFFAVDTILNVCYMCSVFIFVTVYTICNVHTLHTMCKIGNVYTMYLQSVLSVYQRILWCILSTLCKLYTVCIVFIFCTM